MTYSTYDLEGTRTLHSICHILNSRLLNQAITKQDEVHVQPSKKNMES